MNTVSHISVVGDSFVSLSYLFRLGRTTISEIVLDVCEAICLLQTEYLKVCIVSVKN